MRTGPPYPEPENYRVHVLLFGVLIGVLLARGLEALIAWTR